MKKFSFEINKKSNEHDLMRVGTIHTPHGDIKTPAFISVGTKATVKALTPEMIRDYVGADAVLANTYHLYLQPGSELVRNSGGFSNMMNWKNVEGDTLPSFTDSGGFQVFSLGAAFDTGVSKIATSSELSKKQKEELDDNGKKKIKKTKNQMVTIDDEGVTFKSYIDGSSHRFTPETSMRIQHDLGADIFFAFDECTSPFASYEYQLSAMKRTHSWAKRCVDEHKKLGISRATGEQQALFGVVQGGAYEDLRIESAKILDAMDFDGYGIGGCFTKEDMNRILSRTCEKLNENKPRHLLGIGEPIDFFIGVESGIDTFDCVSPTRIARHANIYTNYGKINISNSKYKNDMSKVCEDENCYANKYTKSYLAHLFRADEILASTIASIHNLHFITKLVKDIRQSIIDDKYNVYKDEFLKKYYNK